MAEKETRESVVLRLKRIEGQVKGVQKMIEEERPCPDVLTQLMAIRSGIEQVGLIVLENQIQDCMPQSSAKDIENVETLQKTLKMWAKFG